MKYFKILSAIAISFSVTACTPSNGNKAEQQGPDTVRKDTSALHGGNSANDSTSLHKDSTTNQNADPTGRGNK